jgi:hypothetical protein
MRVVLEVLDLVHWQHLRFWEQTFKFRSHRRVARVDAHPIDASVSRFTENPDAPRRWAPGEKSRSHVLASMVKPIEGLVSILNPFELHHKPADTGT